MGTLFFVLLKKVKCCAYTDTVPTLWFGGTGIYNLDMWRVAFSWPLNICHDHLPIPVASLPEPIYLPGTFHVANDAVPKN